MKLFKNLLLAAALLIAVVLPAKAQLYGPVTIMSQTQTPLTNTVASATTNSYYTNFAAIDCTKYSQIGLSFGATGSNTTNANTVYAVFKQSLDGTTNTTETIGSLKVPLVLTGTTYAVTVTNYALNAVGYLFLDSIQNAGGVSITNINVSYSLKPGKPLY